MGTTSTTGARMDSTGATTTHARSTKKKASRPKTKHMTHHRKTTSTSARVNGTAHGTTRAMSSRSASSSSGVSSGASTRTSTHAGTRRGTRTGTVPDESRPGSQGVEETPGSVNTDSLYGPNLESGMSPSRNPGQGASPTTPATDRTATAGGDMR